VRDANNNPQWQPRSDLAPCPAPKPAVCSERSFVAAGGLISYGADYIDQYRKAAG
jgi:putative ABC transport system substrate-binding protein